jgi:hypothetical protein
LQVESQNVHVQYIVHLPWKTQKEIKVHFSQKGKLQENVEKGHNLIAFIQVSEDSRDQKFRAFRNQLSRNGQLSKVPKGFYSRETLLVFRVSWGVA